MGKANQDRGKIAAEKIFQSEAGSEAHPFVGQTATRAIIR
jgi:hypothetical protein